MKGDPRLLIKRAACMSIMALSLSGCSTVAAKQVVKAGDQVGLQFTCRFPDGSLAASTDPAVADNPKILKSPVFMVRNDQEPVRITAGERLKAKDPRFIMTFEYAVADRLADSVVGMHFGEKRSVTVSAERMPDRPGESSTLKLVAVRKYPKEMRFSPEEFTGRAGYAPAVGKEYNYDPDVPGKVISVSETEVVVGFTAMSGAIVETPFGKGTIRELPDRYEIVLEVKEGRLVRSANLVGVVTSVNDSTFAVDFGHPFGGKTLSCELLAEQPKKERN